MRSILIFIVACIIIPAHVSAQLKPKKQSKKSPYEETSFEDMVHRYYEKESGVFNSVEGIYSVSCTITKKCKNIFSSKMRERIVERKDNYARVAIIKDRPGAKREFIEISLSYHEANKYPIMGELSFLFEQRGLLYKHIEPDGSIRSFTMLNDSELIEGEHTEMRGKKMIIYKLVYLKVYPIKTSSLITGTTN